MHIQTTLMYYVETSIEILHLLDAKINKDILLHKKKTLCGVMLHLGLCTICIVSSLFVVQDAS